MPDSFFINAPNETPEEEFAYMMHPKAGYEILKKVKLFQASIDQVSKLHHNKYIENGKKLPLDIRIISIADAFDSITRKKYINKEPMSFEDAVKEFEENYNNQFDPNLIKIFIKLVTRNNGELFYNRTYAK